MTEEQKIPMYWQNTGKYKNECQAVWDKYVPAQGLNITASEEANDALDNFRAATKAYYRFFNDGDSIDAPDFKLTYNEWERNADNKIALENWIGKHIIKAYKLTDGATLDVVNEDKDRPLKQWYSYDDEEYDDEEEITGDESAKEDLQTIRVGDEVRIKANDRVGVVKMIDADVVSVEYLTNDGIKRNDKYYVSDLENINVSETQKNKTTLKSNYDAERLDFITNILEFEDEEDFNLNFEWTDAKIDEIIELGMKNGKSDEFLKQFIRDSSLEFDEEDIDSYFESVNQKENQTQK